MRAHDPTWAAATPPMGLEGTRARHRQCQHSRSTPAAEPNPGRAARRHVGVGGARCRRPESAWAADTQAGLTRSPVLVTGVSLAARSHCTHELCAVRGEERGGDSALGRHAGVRTRVPGRAGVVPPTLPSGGRVHRARCAPATSELPEDEAPGPPPERWQGGGSRRCSGERPWFPCGTACARPGCSTAGVGPQAMP